MSSHDGISSRTWNKFQEEVSKRHSYCVDTENEHIIIKEQLATALKQLSQARITLQSMGAMNVETQSKESETHAPDEGGSGGEHNDLGANEQRAQCDGTNDLGRCSNCSQKFSTQG